MTSVELLKEFLRKRWFGHVDKKDEQRKSFTDGYENYDKWRLLGKT